MKTEFQRSGALGSPAFGIINAQILRLRAEAIAERRRNAVALLKAKAEVEVLMAGGKGGSNELLAV